MAGILDTGAGYRSEALSGMNRAGALQTQRDMGTKQLKEAEKGQKASMSATGAGIGLLAGMSSGAVAGSTLGAAGGPVGMLVGAGVGYLLSEVF